MYLKNPVLKDHPRLRGEYNVLKSSLFKLSGSSPLARGVPTSSVVPFLLIRIIPACAGSTLFQSIIIELY